MTSLNCNNNKNPKLLSIAIPSYNVENYLERTLNSFAHEAFAQDLDIIIVDDGSSDSTPRIAQSFVDAYPSIFRLVSKENGGHGSAVNAGINHALGKYFRVLDGDDWMLQDQLSVFLEFLKSTQADAIVDTKSEVSFLDGSKEHINFSPFIKTLCDKGSHSFVDLCTRHDVQEAITIHTLTVKTSLLKENSLALLEHCFYVDYEFILKASSCITTLAFIDLEIYQYLVANNAQSTSALGFVRRYDNHQRVLEELLLYYRSFPESLRGRSLPKKTLASLMSYLFNRIVKLIHTQINIALIFDEERNQGRRRARELYHFLAIQYPDYLRATRLRFGQAFILHYLSFDEAKLRRLMQRSSRS